VSKLRVGIVGVGTISGIYLKNLTGMFAGRVEVLGCADMIEGRAEAVAAEHGLPRAYGSVDELLSDSDIDLVLNLTIPAAHHAVSRAVVDAGKHVYGEKPLSVTLKDGKDLLKAAGRAGVRVGSAPDTFLGGGLQTCRKLIEDGVIGTPVAATAFMAGHGPESWHPNPEFYYKTGGGPMFDMGPYYLTALVSLVGPIRRVSGSTRVSFPERTIGSEPLRGDTITVDVPTHIAGTIDFANGAIGTIITSFDVWGANLPRIEIYGSDGSLSVPDPNSFGGEVRVLSEGEKEWTSVPLSHGHDDNSRGIGVVEMAAAIGEARPHRASGELAMHVLEAMHGFHIASDSGRAYDMTSPCTKPEPLPSDF
jgi:predicted dehydrogenase